MSATARAGGRRRPAPFGLLGDERLAQRVGRGDERAFAVVYERYHQILYRYCRSILHSHADAEDALQSTFAAAFAALGAGQRDAPMRPWLFRIAHNESVSVLRRRRPTAELSAASEHGATSIEDEVAERAKFSLLLRDLRELTDRQRSALVLRELSGLSHQDIAIALGTSVGGAKQTIFEARQSLFEFAEGRAMACDEIRRTISDADGRALRSRRVRAHLRECGGCAAFAAAIPARTGELRALAPALPAAAAGGLLGRLALSQAAHGGAGIGTNALAGAVAKTGIAGASFGANALAGVAVVASATVAVTVGVDKFVNATAPARAVRAVTSAAAHTRTPHAPSASSLPGSPAAGLKGAAAGQATSRTGANRWTPATLQVGTTIRRHGNGSHAAGSGRPAWAHAPAGTTTAGSSTANQHGHASGQSSTSPGRVKQSERTAHGKPPWTGSGKGSSSSAVSGKSGSSGAAGTSHSSATRSGKSAHLKSASPAVAVTVPVSVTAPPVDARSSATGLAHRHK